MMKIQLGKLGVLTGMLAMLALPGVAQASDLVSFKTVFNTDFAAAGYGGMRDIGSGSIALAGVSGTVTEAYLFWAGPTNASPTDTGANASVNFAGTDIVGTFLGLSSDNCWGFANSMAYRANVSSLVSGNGSYSLDGFVKSSGAINVNGASLVVFFDDGDTTNNRDIVMFNGNDSNITNPFDADGWNISLNGIQYTSGSAGMQLHVSDGQDFTDDALVVNATTIAPVGGNFNGNSTPGGAGGPSNGFLWDIKDYDITSLLDPGNNDLDFSTGVNGDCLSCVMIAIDLPAGAAPDQPDDNGVPEPGTLALVGLASAALGLLRRRQRA